ncbi:MAG: nucleotidyltransferase domain-containing protein [bacterium]|nr:nucleotidyltransferase domain-containing protein [bacterium]
MGLEDVDFNLIIDFFRSIPNVEEAIVFGSRALGNARRGSDIDLALKGAKLQPDECVSIRQQLNEEHPLPYFFDVIHYATITNSELKSHIDRRGQVIYQKTG